MNTINNNYILTAKDLIEAKHLAHIKDKQFKLSLVQLLFFLAILILTFWRIKDPDFLVANDYLKQLNDRETTDYLIQQAIWVSIAFLLYLGITFPRYDIFYRWSLWRKYQQNFVFQETKNISITETGFTIESANYRQTRQWQNCDRIVENKQIFLLFHSREKESIVIPKRIFNNASELNTFRNFTNNLVNPKSI